MGGRNQPTDALPMRTLPWKCLKARLNSQLRSGVLLARIGDKRSNERSTTKDPNKHRLHEYCGGADIPLLLSCGGAGISLVEGGGGFMVCILLRWTF